MTPNIDVMLRTAEVLEETILGAVMLGVLVFAAVVAAVVVKRV